MSEGDLRTDHTPGTELIGGLHRMQSDLATQPERPVDYCAGSAGRSLAGVGRELTGLALLSLLVIPASLQCDLPPRGGAGGAVGQNGKCCNRADAEEDRGGGEDKIECHGRSDR